jgi:SAM-dependent methyltransferase
MAQSKSKNSARKSATSSPASSSKRRNSAASAKERGTRKPRAEKMYREIASWWPLLSSPEDYEEEAAFYLATLQRGCERKPATLLELGSGGGNNAWYMKKAFEKTVLVDLSPEMLAVSRKLNPDCEHQQGDMRSVRLGRTFDCVFVHDAVMYMASEKDVRKAMKTAFVHCNAGGAALFCPDYVRETFKPETDCGGHDAPRGLRGMRYLDWVWDPDPNDNTYTVDYAYLLRDEKGAVRVEHDRHVEGLFPRADWIRWIDEAGFRTEGVPFNHSDLEPGRYEIFLARKP